MGEREDEVLEERETIYGIDLCIPELVLVVVTEAGDAIPFLGTSSCQQGILLFAFEPVQVLYLPCCELPKSFLLNFYNLIVLFSVGGGKIFCFL